MKNVKEKFTEMIFEEKSFLKPLFDIYKSTVKDVIVEKDSESVKTACVQQAGDNGFVIRINEDFMKRKMTGKYDLLWVLIHELSHIFFEHFKYAVKICPEFTNFCADINCNSLMFNLNRKKRIKVLDRCYGSFYKKMLKNRFFTEKDLMFLLAPPSKSRKSVEQDFKKIVNLSPSRKNTLISLWFDNYLKPGMPVPQLESILKRFIRKRENFTYISLVNSELTKISAVKTAVSGFIDHIKTSLYCRNASSIEKIKIKFQEGGNLRKAELLKKLMEKVFCENMFKSVNYKNDLVESTGVIPNFSRKQLSLINCGVNTLFYQNKIPARVKSDEFSPVYIDQSGSMESYKELIYILLRKISDLFPGPYFVFSSELKKITLQDVKEGNAITGGTDINPVVEHINSCKFKKALIITDGCFKKPDTRAKAETYVILPSKSCESHALKSTMNDIGDIKGIFYLDVECENTSQRFNQLRRRRPCILKKRQYTR
ncbi:hypothetical protein JXA84_03580 [candidate division WOR-3 bacterium]|nr:hypothetical protein [candidate division WOR-3 bacterium]